MITLIWKEFRENLKWALLAALGLGAAEVYGLYPHSYQDVSLGAYYGETLVRPTFLTVTTFGCAGVGFLLGLLQVLPELKRDRWAALLHRPASRGAIFRGKVAAGLLLYLIAALIPFLFCVWLVALPGMFALPFVPEMTLPGTADLCMGVVYYFAALATGLPRGSWLLRVFPILAAVYTSVFVLNQQYFYVAVEASVLMALAQFTAAWGQIHGQDALANRPWLGKVAFLAVVFYGFCYLSSYTQSFLNSLNPTDSSFWRHYELTDQGVPLIETDTQGGIILAMQNVDGSPVTDPRYKADRVRNHLLYRNDVSSYIGDSHNWHWREYKPRYREMSGFFWEEQSTGLNTDQWFYLRKDRYYVGFQANTRRPFEVYDAKGFHPSSEPVQSFGPQDEQTGGGQDVYCFWNKDSIRFVHFYSRSSTPLVLPSPGPVYGVAFNWATTNHGSKDFAFVALAGGIAVYDQDGALVTELPYHYDTSRWGDVLATPKAKLDGFFVWYKPSGFIGDRESHTMPQYVEEVDLKGQVIHAYTMPPLPPDPPRPRNWQGFLNPRLQTPAFYFGSISYQGIGGLFGSDRLKSAFVGTFKPGHNIEQFEELSLYILGHALILAIVALVWARRRCFAPQRAWSWAWFVFAFGLPGFLTFLVAADWPQLVRCPSCGRGRPVDTASCPHCKTGWPSPPVTGIEIFDPTEKEAAVPAA